MSAKHAVLGLLVEGPAYQYELCDQLKHRLGPAWEVDTGQMSRIISSLEDDGFVARIDRVASTDPRRRFWRITEPGVEERERWLNEEVEGVRLSRRPLLTKITLAGPQWLKEKALTQIDAYEADCMRAEKELHRLLNEIPPDGPLLRADNALLRVNLSANVAHLETEIAWATNVRQTISWLVAHRSVLWPGTHDSRDG